MRNLFSFLIIFLIFPQYLAAQDQIESGAISDTIIVNKDFFEDDAPLVFTMTFDIKHFQRNKYEGKYMPAELIYSLGDSTEITKNIRLKARGNFRRSFCSMPPFWLNIRKANVVNKSLQGVVRMKVVTHCNGGKASGDYVLKEFLAYKIFNILSPYSFRASLVKMKYIDTGRKNKLTENWAIIIEPEEMLTERLDVYSIENDKLSMKHMLPEHMDIVAMFNYMIGNGDYSVTGRQNLKLFGLKEFAAEGFIPVPYDFDYSGVVNAFYAIPGEKLGIESVTERYYLGACREIETYQSTIDYFNSKKDEIMEMINSFPYLDLKKRAEMISYLEAFYEESSYPGYISKNIKSTCR